MDYCSVQDINSDIIYYGIYNTEVEIHDGSDVLCSIRKKFFENGIKQKSQGVFYLDSEIYRYSYKMENNHPLKWRKKLNSNDIEYSYNSTFGGYIVNTFDKERKPVKKTYYTNHHIWLKTEYFTFENRIEPFCTLTPSSENSKPTIIRKEKNGQTDVLYPYVNVTDEKLKEKLNALSGETNVYCCTSYGDFYFCKKQNNIIETIVEDNKKIQEKIQDEIETKTENNSKKNINENIDGIINEFVNSNKNLYKKTLTDSKKIKSEKKNFEEKIFEEDNFKDDGCNFSKSCPLENMGKLIIESDGKRYYYFGDVKNEVRSGHGRTVMKNGYTAYDGDYINDERSGFGVYYYKSGMICYAGSWKNNKRCGLGVAFSSSDGSAEIGRWNKNFITDISASFDNKGTFRYLGRSINGNPDGIGIIYEEEQEIFLVGKYKNGKFVNFGTQFDKLGNMLYTGEIKNDFRDGIGTSYNDDGTIKYKGNWKNGFYDGEGTLYLSVGGKLEGTFKKGKANGECILTDDSGKIIYEGGFVNDAYNGKGRLYSDDGGYAEGIFSEGEPIGVFNEYDSCNNLMYSGEWNDMHRNGNGTEFKNGEKIYEGGFCDSVYNGEGKFYSDGHLIYSGNFKNGKRDGIGTEFSEDDLIYRGMWKDNLYDGCGILYDDGEAKWIGCFKKGLKHGRINEISHQNVIKKCLYENDELVYVCEFGENGTLQYYGSVRDGKHNGMGCTFSEDNEKQFEGIFKNDFPNKAMKVFLKELSELPECDELKETEYELFRCVQDYVVEKIVYSGIYTGKLENGLPEGKGTILYVDHRYTGMFFEGKACGEGIIYTSSGNIINGIFIAENDDNNDSNSAEKIEFNDVSYYVIRSNEQEEQE